MNLTPLVQDLARGLQQRRHMLATAESCTGGLVAAACTDVPGSSAWFERGFVTYSNAAKEELLGVPPEMLARHGAVSEAVARAMARGAARHAGVACALALTGVAGPDGGSADKPVGLVWFGWQVGAHTHSQCRHFCGSRQDVRQAATECALRGMLELLRADGNIFS